MPSTVPEPVRQALIDGGNYWRKSFEAAGFIDAFRVELMPHIVDFYGEVVISQSVDSHSGTVDPFFTIRPALNGCPEHLCSGSKG